MSSNCLGLALPSRRPAPPAAMMALTCMGERRLYVRGQLCGAPGDYLADGGGELADGFLRDGGRLDRRVYDHPHAAGTDHQLAPEHHVTAPDDRDGHDRQARIEGDDERTSLE